MRPRLISRGNPDIEISATSRRQRFNEAATDQSRKSDRRRLQCTRWQGFNEAATDQSRKFFRWLIADIAAQASMRPRLISRGNLSG